MQRATKFTVIPTLLQMLQYFYKLHYRDLQKCNLITSPTRANRYEQGGRDDEGRGRKKKKTKKKKQNEEEVDNEKHNNKTRTRPSKKEALGIIAEYGTYGSFELPYCVLQ